MEEKRCVRPKAELGGMAPIGRGGFFYLESLIHLIIVRPESFIYSCSGFNLHNWSRYPQRYNTYKTYFQVYPVFQCFLKLVRQPIEKVMICIRDPGFNSTQLELPTEAVLQTKSRYPIV